MSPKTIGATYLVLKLFCLLEALSTDSYPPHTPTHFFTPQKILKNLKKFFDTMWHIEFIKMRDKAEDSEAIVAIAFFIYWRHITMVVISASFFDIEYCSCSFSILRAFYSFCIRSRSCPTLSSRAKRQLLKAILGSAEFMVVSWSDVATPKPINLSKTILKETLFTTTILHQEARFSYLCVHKQLWNHQ